MDKPSLVGLAIRRAWHDDTHRRKAEVFDQINKLLDQKKKRPGPKGPREITESRRLWISFLWLQGLRGKLLCSRLKEQRIPLPSKQLVAIYGKYDWMNWFQCKPNDAHRQISADRKRLLKIPQNS